MKAERPHDAADLLLAPVALHVDERLEELGRLSHEDLYRRVALDANVESHSHSERERGLLGTVTHLIDMHGWRPSWDSRGLRLTHETHTLVLGVPAVFEAYLNGATNP